jgi:protein CrcB
VLSFVWVALGGALGSMARAWLGLVMAHLTGPQFPWGTVLINVLGSFVIGAFGRLTAAEGRVPLSQNMRTLVMVGVCGGFTTFSSFSLQTLVLMQTQHPGQALGNVALSCVLCLASVAAGAGGAAALNRRRSRGGIGH